MIEVKTAQLCCPTFCSLDNVYPIRRTHLDFSPLNYIRSTNWFEFETRWKVTYEITKKIDVKSILKLLQITALEYGV